MTRKASLAKLSRPRLFGVIQRERLFTLLDENRGRPLVWLSGPPGAGKTTLVATYLENRELPALWYQVDPGDADPASFFYYLSVAARTLGGADFVALPRFVAEHLADLPAFSRLFFRSFFSQLPDGSILVLDNYQEAPQEASLHGIVRQAIAEVPPDSSLICISRLGAPQTFAQAHVNGAMCHVGWDDLRLTFEEVQGIATQRRVTSASLLKALYEQSEGWAAGVTLMLERLGHLDRNSQTLPAETRESVFNYFASLIFDQASETTRRILLSIAFLPRVTPTLANRLSDSSSAAELLEDLYHRRMFTDRRPGPEPVYQLHALFLDFLKTRARATLDTVHLEALLHRSASALETRGEVEAAMEIWLEERNWMEGARIAIKEANNLLGSGRRQTLLRWLHCFPDEVQAREPWLVYWLGRAQLEVGPEEGVKTLEAALARFRLSEDRHGTIECLAALLGGAFLGFHALDAMDRWLDELLAELGLSPESAPSDVDLRIWGVLCVTLFHLRPWHPLTVPAYRRVSAMLVHCNDPNVALVAAMHALVVSGLCGDFECGDRIASASKPLATRENASPSEAAWWFAQVGWLRFVESRYDEALENLQKGCQIAEANGLRLVLRQIILWRFTVEWRSVGWSVANVSLANVEAMPRSTQPMIEATLQAFRARRAAHCGQKDAAAALASLSQEAVMRTRSRLEEVVFSLTNADVYLHVSRYEEAELLLTRVRALIERAPIYRCFHAGLVLMEARCTMVRGNRTLALAQLREALALAREGNGRHYLRFSDWAMPPLFTLALDEGIEVDLVHQIIRMFRLKPSMGAPDLWPWPIRIRTLGRFEVLVNDERLGFSRKVPKKTLALLKVLVAYGGQEVSEQSLCDSLWSDEEADAARQALGITVVRLRKLLGANDAVLQQGGKISLDRTQCWVDAWQFEERTVQSNEPGAIAKGLTLYVGMFLPEDGGEAWSVQTRERLRGKFIHLLATHGHSLEAGGDTLSAIELYLRGVDADPIVEMFYQGLMRCYRSLDRHTEAISAYRRLRHTLSILLGVAPSRESQDLYRTIMDACAERTEAKEDQSVIPLATTPQSRPHRSRPARRAG